MTCSRWVAIGHRDPSEGSNARSCFRAPKCCECFPICGARSEAAQSCSKTARCTTPRAWCSPSSKARSRPAPIVCNYAEAMRFLWAGDSVRGVRVRDGSLAIEFDVRARLDAQRRRPLGRLPPAGRPQHSVPVSACPSRATPTSSSTARPPRLRHRRPGPEPRQGRAARPATRHLFAAPWRDKTLLGVWHELFPDAPDTAQVEPDEIEDWMAEINTVYPTLRCRPMK